MILLVFTLALGTHDQIAASQALKSGRKRYFLQWLYTDSTNDAPVRIFLTSLVICYAESILLWLSQLYFDHLARFQILGLLDEFLIYHDNFIALWTLDCVLIFESMNKPFLYSRNFTKVYDARRAILVLEATIQPHHLSVLSHAV